MRGLLVSFANSLYDDMQDDDAEQLWDAEEEPDVHHFDVWSFREWGGGLWEEGVQHQQCGEADGQAYLQCTALITSVLGDYSNTFY